MLKILFFSPDIVLQPSPAITFLTIGGILDFFIYMGPTPNDVVHQHMITVGLPFMPPYFSLGYLKT
jgi:lysosomal alpha-glucosidase